MDESAASEAQQLIRRYERLLENAADVILVLDATGTLTYASPSVGRVLGYAPDDYLGKNVLGFVHPDDIGRVESAFQSAQTTPGVHDWIPFRVRHADGRWCDMEGASNVLLEEPSVQGIVVNLRDVGKQRRAEAERSALLGLLSHDLRTPLTAILTRAQLLGRRLGGRGTTDPAALQADAAMIEQAAWRMEAMLTELVDLARLEQGEALALDLGPIDLVALSERLVAEARATSPGHELRLETGGPRLIGIWDEARLGRAVANLLSNATKYSPPGSTVSVHLARHEDETGAWAELVVVDAGIGIPAAELAHITEPFYRAANVTDRRAGTGLGLFGVSRIVEQHGGRVQITSTEGQGTRVTVRLPLTAA